MGVVAAGVTVALALGFIFAHATWYMRTLVFAPAAMAAIGFLQANRNTCVAHARQGTIEHDDFSMTNAPADQVEASRRVASGILRDALLLGLAAALVAAATSLIP
jgi:hypothetical protein